MTNLSAQMRRGRRGIRDSTEALSMRLRSDQSTQGDETRENIRVSRIKEEKHELSADGSSAHFRSRCFNVCKCEIIRAWRLIYDSIFFERTKKELHRELDPVFPIER